MNAQTPISLAAEVESLFTLPDIVLRLNKLLDSPEVNTHEISAVVELDPGLASSVLRLSNSPVFGQHGKVGSANNRGQTMVSAILTTVFYILTYRHAASRRSHPSRHSPAYHSTRQQSPAEFLCRRGLSLLSGLACFPAMKRRAPAD